MKYLESLVIAFSMYSKVPMPKIEWKTENMKYAMCFFPAVGILIGALVGIWEQLSGMLPFGKLFISVVFVLIPLLVTGGIHMDGYMDTMDALSSYKTQEQRLEILKDPRAGAFAVLFAGIYLLADLGIWSELTSDGIRVLCVGFVLSRALSGLSVTQFTCAKNSGLAATFSGMAHRQNAKRVLIAEVFFAMAAMVALNPVPGILSCAAAMGVFAYYRHMSYKNFGGITGDLAGWFLQMAELFMALAVMIGEKIWF